MSDLEKLLAMKAHAQSLAAAEDPLLAGAVAQLVGLIEGLIRLADPATISDVKENRFHR